MSTYKSQIKEALTAAKEAKSIALANVELLRTIPTLDDLTTAIFYLRRALDQAPATHQAEQNKEVGNA